MEITLYEKMQNPLEAVDRLGDVMASSGMFGCDNKNAGKVLAMICMVERKSPVELMRTYDIIGGKLRKKALASYAEFRQKGGKVEWLKLGDDGKEARAKLTFEGQTIELSFTMEQAIKGGAIMKPGSNWQKTPGNMLRARLLSNGIAILCPEIFAGGEDDDEINSAPAPAIKLEPAKATITSEHVTTAAPIIPSPAPQVEPAKPVIVEAEVVPNKPAPTTAPVELVAQPELSPVATTSDKLSDSIIENLEKAIGEYGPQALSWMTAQNWIKKGQTLADLTTHRANQILSRPAAFIRAITGAAK